MFSAYVQEIFGSNWKFNTSNPDQGLLQFYAVPPCRYQDSNLKWAMTVSLTDPFQFTIYPVFVKIISF
jgi:hypothetical protein